VELRLDPERDHEIRARYGVGAPDAWAQVTWLWQDRMNRDPALHRRWMELTAGILAARGRR